MCDCGTCCNQCGHYSTCISNDYDQGQEAWDDAFEDYDH